MKRGQSQRFPASKVLALEPTQLSSTVKLLLKPGRGEILANKEAASPSLPPGFTFSFIGGTDGKEDKRNLLALVSLQLSLKFIA